MKQKMSCFVKYELKGFIKCLKLMLDISLVPEYDSDVEGFPPSLLRTH